MKTKSTRSTALTTTATVTAARDAWISPGEAANMIFDVRAEGCDAVGYGLLRLRSKGVDRSVLELATAKLQPVKPTAGSWTTRCGTPVTARDHRLVLAPCVPDAVSLGRLMGDYDAATRPHQKLLAAVLTMKLPDEMTMHDGFDMVLAYTTIRLARERRLSSLVVLHTPAEEADDAAAHAHVVVLARTHRAGGAFAGVHPDLTDDNHQMWAEEWLDFQRAWARQLEQ